MQPQNLRLCVRHEDDAYWATVEEFPGVFATGDDLDELRESLQEGIALVLREPGGEIPKILVSPIRPEPERLAATSELIRA
jgi:predicted RNase H-like HicB family nuclease